MKVEYRIPNEVSPREYRAEAPAHGITRITELLYADDEAIFANSIEELKTILQIYDRTFAHFGLKMSCGKTETMAFNVDEEIKSQESLITIGDNKSRTYELLSILGTLLLMTKRKHPVSYMQGLEQLTKNGVTLNMSSLIDESSCRPELDF